MPPQPGNSETPATRKQRREAARERRRTEEAQLAARRGRIRRLEQLTAIAAVAVVAVVAGILLSGSPGNLASTGVGAAGGGSGSVAGVQQISTELAGIPQSGMTLGRANAPVTISEYGDLQCTACRAFSSDTLPGVIDKLVRTGAAKLVFHTWPIIDQTDSVTAARAAYAAARQGKAWQFIELFYGNQGQERSGYVTDGFLMTLAGAAGLDVMRFNTDRAGAAAGSRVGADTREALALGFQGTPSFTVTGPRGTRIVNAGMPGDVQPFLDGVAAVS